MPISNAEKQARFRKKEGFNKYVNQVSRDCQFIAGSKPYLQSAFGDIDSHLREAASLPAGWTDEDLARAATRVRNIHGDVLGAVDQLGADVQEARDARETFLDSPHPRQWLAQTEKAKRDTLVLAGHLISALELSQLPNEERAAALLEAARFIGRAIANSGAPGRSAATAVCLAAVNPHYQRPDWFAERLADWLCHRLDPDTQNAVAEGLAKRAGGSPPMSNVDVDQFDRELGCTYRDEMYTVRDNGAVRRHPREGLRRRPLDSTWTFGAPCASSGYMKVSAEAVHRIVATAFHGPQPSKDHVVDHIDTNRRNNRPDNLRWVTRLENILLNPITAKRVIYHYGSIESFLADPRNPRTGTLMKDFEWMRTVSPEEAEYSRERLLEWTRSDQRSSGGTLGDWVYGPRQTPIPKTAEGLVKSKTPCAVQRRWRVPAEFPLCPQSAHEHSLQAYFNRLEKNSVFSISPYGEVRVVEVALTSDGTALIVLGSQSEGAVKPWTLAKVTLEDDNFVHESRGTFFGLTGAQKQFALIQGLPWEGGDSIDDYC